MYLLSFLIFINIYTVIGGFKLLVLHLPTIADPKLVELLILAIINIGLYFLFIKNKKYESLFKDYLESEYYNKKGTYLTMSYIVITFILFIGLMWL